MLSDPITWNGITLNCSAFFDNRLLLYTPDPRSPEEREMLDPQGEIAQAVTQQTLSGMDRLTSALHSYPGLRVPPMMKAVLLPDALLRKALPALPPWATITTRYLTPDAPYTNQAIIFSTDYPDYTRQLPGQTPEHEPIHTFMASTREQFTVLRDATLQDSSHGHIHLMMLGQDANHILTTDIPPITAYSLATRPPYLYQYDLHYLHTNQRMPREALPFIGQSTLYLAAIGLTSLYMQSHHCSEEEAFYQWRTALDKRPDTLKWNYALSNTLLPSASLHWEIEHWASQGQAFLKRRFDRSLVADASISPEEYQHNLHREIVHECAHLIGKPFSDLGLYALMEGCAEFIARHGRQTHMPLSSHFLANIPRINWVTSGDLLSLDELNTAFADHKDTPLYRNRAYASAYLAVVGITEKFRTLYGREEQRNVTSLEAFCRWTHEISRFNDGQEALQHIANRIYKGNLPDMIYDTYLQHYGQTALTQHYPYTLALNAPTSTASHPEVSALSHGRQRA